MLSHFRAPWAIQMLVPENTCAPWRLRWAYRLAAEAVEERSGALSPASNLCCGTTRQNSLESFWRN